MRLEWIIEGDMIADSERIRTLFSRDIEANIALVDVMSDPIAKAGLRLVNCLLSDGTIFICGAGGSVANCLHFSSAMLNCFEAERPSLPVINLTADVSALTAAAQEGKFEQIFARQMQALGQSNDVLIVLSTTGHANALIHVVEAAHDKGIDTIALTGRDGGALVNYLNGNDIELRIPGESSARIRETHLFILHCFCDVIDRALFGNEYA